MNRYLKSVNNLAWSCFRKGGGGKQVTVIYSKKQKQNTLTDINQPVSLDCLLFFIEDVNIN